MLILTLIAVLILVKHSRLRLHTELHRWACEKEQMRGNLGSMEMQDHPLVNRVLETQSWAKFFQGNCQCVAIRRQAQSW
ncbi:uncharacterized protein B0I36DRAFT_317740 [Microdochium trichocladiopsis]|uniref:Secreted protein n=1 Tax=Microdochium trichocladiopsis TaxID=1682393 RepID=A0A9P8Y8X2_9PEZI|nr:uncharacterized protein B0I36DRAFT_317740 [Microdochium trichocladiopsis]KAH7035149.1 hypothetical protein B0I36DRAFT_317740 [Microdochium trichocladiopsis]